MARNSRQGSTPSTRAWFRPRRYGWGVTPVTWQGWVLTLALVAGLVLIVQLAEGRPALLVLLVPLVLVYLRISRDRTDGGLGWRWGE